jgi:serine/threonine-protein kinase
VHRDASAGARRRSGEHAAAEAREGAQAEEAARPPEEAQVTAYRLDRELGRGGMAVVYAGWQEALDRPVALKVLAEHLAGDDELRERFLREARIASKLQHPNLVRVFDVSEVDGLPCIVMELVEGLSVTGTRLTVEEAAHVADGLAHAHAQDVVHRDLKPANILRGSDGAIKVADFGIARAAEDSRLTQTGTVLGTLRYLAPEQAEGRPVGPEADVYSLGVVLDELLAEKPPDVGRLIERARSRDPRGRPTAREFAVALRDPAPTVAAPTRVLTRHTSRRVWPAVIAALLVAGGGVAAVVAATDGGSPRRTQPVQHADGTAQQARNLAAWLRENSR